MRTVDFNYEYPSNLVATQPAESRLLRYDRKSQRISHEQMNSFDHFLGEKDLLIFNSSEVLPARFYGKKTSGAKVEGLFLGQEGRVWLKAKIKAGDSIELQNGPVVQVLERLGKEAKLSISSEDFVRYLKEEGLPAIPPYIRQARRHSGLAEDSDFDLTDYQTEFAKESEGFSVAAPTASLHFKAELFSRIKNRQPHPEYLQLFVGAGTFAPIESEEIETHPMHSELVHFPERLWERIVEHKKDGGRIIAVGTTVMRSLEARARTNENAFWTNLYIQPGFEFKIVDSLVTNFHQPKSSLLVLVASFMEAGTHDLTHQWKRVYSEAIESSYRLFSYGDAMWIE